MNPALSVDVADAVRSVLVWAAGGHLPPRLHDAPVDVLFEALRMHRVDRRLLDRARDEVVALPPALADLLEERRRQVDERVATQLELFVSVRDAVRERDPGAGLIPLKGFNLYALTGDERHSSFSVDLDVVGPDPHAVAAAVETGSGYHFHGEEHPYVYAHMDAVEVHTRYVVTGMPVGVRPEDVDLRVRRGVVTVPRPFTITSVTYEDLAAHLAPGRGAAEGIDVLRPEMAVLIRCAHVYVGFAMNTQPLPLATVRLEELVQIRAYLELPGFDAEVFRHLHKRFEADLVTDFVRRVHLDLVGTDPFAPVLASSEPVRQWFPQNLWWDGVDNGFPVELDWDVDSLLVAPPDGKDLVDVLGAWEVPLGPEGTATVALGGPGAVHDDSARYVRHEFHGGTGELGLTLDAQADGLRVAVRFPAVRDDQMVALGLATGNRRYELFYRPGAGSHDFSDYTRPKPATPLRPRALSCVREAGGVTVELELPWTGLGRSAAPVPGESLPLTVRARVQDRPWGAVAGGVVAPLRLRRT